MDAFFNRGDIVIDKKQRWFRFSRSGNIVEAVSDDKNYIRVDGEWISTKRFRWIGTVALYRARLKEQDLLIPELMGRHYYSPERKIEVVESAIVIRDRFAGFLAQIGHYCETN